MSEHSSPKKPSKTRSRMIAAGAALVLVGTPIAANEAAIHGNHTAQSVIDPLTSNEMVFHLSCTKALLFGRDAANARVGSRDEPCWLANKYDHKRQLALK